MELKSKRSQGLALFFGGLLPVIAFTVIEDQYGVIAGLLAGVAFGVGEIIWELLKYRKVQRLTWIGNGMLIGLGALSLISSEGMWFKLQPALMEGLFALTLWGSLLLGKNLITAMVEAQGQQLPEIVKTQMRGLSFRLGLFFAVHAVIATWAALHWSTASWALLKGVGLTVSFVLYLGLEVWWLRIRIRNLSRLQNKDVTPPIPSPK